MKKVSLKIARSVRYPFYHVTLETRDEQFLKDEYRIVWEEAEVFGMSITIEERIEILKTMDCVTHIDLDGTDYFYCKDAGVYWEELTNILDQKHKEE